MNSIWAVTRSSPKEVSSVIRHVVAVEGLFVVKLWSSISQVPPLHGHSRSRDRLPHMLRM